MMLRDGQNRMDGRPGNTGWGGGAVDPQAFQSQMQRQGSTPSGTGNPNMQFSGGVFRNASLPQAQTSPMSQGSGLPQGQGQLPGSLGFGAKRPTIDFSQVNKDSQLQPFRPPEHFGWPGNPGGYGTPAPWDGGGKQFPQFPTFPTGGQTGPGGQSGFPNSFGGVVPPGMGLYNNQGINDPLLHSKTEISGWNPYAQGNMGWESQSSPMGPSGPSYQTGSMNPVAQTPPWQGGGGGTSPGGFGWKNPFESMR